MPFENPRALGLHTRNQRPPKPEPAAHARVSSHRCRAHPIRVSRLAAARRSPPLRLRGGQGGCRSCLPPSAFCLLPVRTLPSQDAAVHTPYTSLLQSVSTR